MIALLDINVLIALFDSTHIHHDLAHEWFADNRQHGWATCPITENGFVRIISNNRYPGRHTTVSDAISRLTTFIESGDHVFWADNISLVDGAIFNPDLIGSHKKITDCYLLALAAINQGHLVTFDQSIQPNAIKNSNNALTIICP